MPLSLLKESTELKERIVAHRRFLHAHAETGFDLPKTAAYVMDTLRQLGYHPEKCGKCGIVADIGRGEPDILLRADMDALPVREKSSLPFACKNGMAHVCGHDMHTAMLLGAGELLRRHEAALKGRVRLMFQPAEELLAGASDMLDRGLLQEFHPQAALMLHVMSTEGLKPGTVIIPPAGVSAPAADMFEIRLLGKGCHGAMPQNGIDVINAASHLVLSLQTITTREISLNDPHAITIATFQAGEAANVMPDRAVLRGSARSYDIQLQQMIKRRIAEISRTTARTFRAKATVQWLNGCPTLINKPELVDMANEMLPEIIGEDRVLAARQLSGGSARSVGSEDFSYISQQVPSLMLAMAAGDASCLPLHHPAVVFSEDALPYGAAVYAGFAMAFCRKDRCIQTKKNR